QTRNDGRLVGERFDLSIPSTKSWYELASLTNRRPLESTASNPGLARSSMMCGKTDKWPSGCFITELGIHSAELSNSVTIAPVAPAPAKSPSPVFESETSE